MLAASEADIKILAQNDIAFVLFDFYQLLYIKQVSQKLGQKVKVHLKIDTGMNRLGFKQNDWPKSKSELKNYASFLEIVGVFSHFSDANNQEFSKQQQKIMAEALDYFGLQNCLSHFSASLASLNFSNSNCGALRPGALVYGYSANNKATWLKPTLSLKTKIVQLKWVKPGEAVGYELFFKPKQKTLIGIMPIGYKDNFSRRFSFVKTKVIINGKLYPVVGRVCMRFSFIDVTPLADKITVGQEVVLLGRENKVKIDAYDWAEKLGTSFYEVLATFPRDLPRVYKPSRITE
jgi:alanine racemase